MNQRLRALCDLSMGSVREYVGRHEYDGRVEDLSPEGVRAGLARVGPHGLGLDIDPAGRIRRRDGSAADRTWLIGPLRRGAQWETTAVPEIRTQARRLAATLSEVGGRVARHPEPVI